MVLAEKPTRRSLVDGAQEALRSWLAPGRYRSGDRLPPEHELAAMLGVSRGTLRSALTRLADTGEIVRRQGSGTFVGAIASPTALGGQPRRLESYSTHTRVPEVALTVVSLRIEHRPPGPHAAEALAIGPRDRTLVVSRTLAAGDAPARVTVDVFHPELALPAEPALRRTLREGHEMFDVLVSAGVSVSGSRTKITPVLVSSVETLGRRLKLADPTACLELEEVVHGEGGRTILYSRDVYTPSAIELEFTQSVRVPPLAPVSARYGNGDCAH